MKAMILAAGLGTRLRPLTDTRPKALVEINGRTLLEITLSRLRPFGVTEVIINVHHFADMVVQYLKSKNNFGMRIEISREDDLLLDTGGGLKKASWFFLEDSTRPDPTKSDEPFLLHNVDVISNIDLNAMLQFHKENHALATLAVAVPRIWAPAPLQRPTPTLRPPRRRQRSLSFRAKREISLLRQQMRAAPTRHSPLPTRHFPSPKNPPSSSPWPSPASTSSPPASSLCSPKAAPSPSSTPTSAYPPKAKKSWPSATTTPTGATSANPPT